MGGREQEGRDVPRERLLRGAEPERADHAVDDRRSDDDRSSRLSDARQPKPLREGGRRGRARDGPPHRAGRVRSPDPVTLSGGRRLSADRGEADRERGQRLLVPPRRAQRARGHGVEHDRAPAHGRLPDQADQGAPESGARGHARRLQGEEDAPLRLRPGGDGERPAWALRRALRGQEERRALRERLRVPVQRRPRLRLGARGVHRARGDRHPGRDRRRVQVIHRGQARRLRRRRERRDQRRREERCVHHVQRRSPQRRLARDRSASASSPRRTPTRPNGSSARSSG